MCIICKLWELEKITTLEAKKAAWEIINTGGATPEHLEELYGKLTEAEEIEKQLDINE